MPERKGASQRTARRRGPQSGEDASRPLWSGTISFGLVSIPVELYPASRDSRVHLHLLGPDGEPLRREYHAGETGRNLSRDETTRGFEVGKGKYVTVSEEELDRLAPDKSRNIDLRVFVGIEEISPFYFDKAYILTPGGSSAKAYHLLAATMEESGRAGVATFVMRGHEYLVAIIARGGIIRGQTLRFGDELRTPSDVGLPKKKPEVSPAVVRKFEEAIGKASRKGVDTKELKDVDAQAMLKLIHRKQARAKNIVESEPAPGRPAQVVDLMEVLKKSLGKGSRAKRAA